MSDKSNQRTKLLAEVFHENWDDGAIALLAQRAAAHARRHRRLRRSFLATGALGGAIAAFLLLSPAFRTSSAPHPTAHVKLDPGYEIISDEELFAQLHDRALLIVQKENGARELVFLER